jgi:hypothetical protein
VQPNPWRYGADTLGPVASLSCGRVVAGEWTRDRDSSIRSSPSLLCGPLWPGPPTSPRPRGPSPSPVMAGSLNHLAHGLCADSPDYKAWTQTPPFTPAFVLHHSARILRRHCHREEAIRAATSIAPLTPSLQEIGGLGIDVGVWGRSRTGCLKGLRPLAPSIAHRSRSSAMDPHTFVGRAQLGVSHGKDPLPRLAFISSSCSVVRLRK